MPEVLFLKVDCLGLYRSMASLCSCGEGATLHLRCAGFSLPWLLSGSMGYKVSKLQELWHVASAAVGPAHAQLWLAANRLSCSAACGILPEQAPSCVSCIGRQVL